MGELSATLFIELTSDGLLREWLPKLVGFECALGIEVGGELAPSVPEEAHVAARVRGHNPPSVRYVGFPFTAALVDAFEGPDEVAVVARHPEYEQRTVLTAPVREELLGDLRGTTKPLPIG